MAIGWIDRMLDITASASAEKQRRGTYVEVLRYLPDGGVVDDQKADGSRLVIYIQPIAEPEVR
ncbi:hypothetical protein ACFWN2_34165 [Lentzea sp. NPDC058436]|uniref:hypothetical protein n=1 Tax=Lentzea sp. NPDC058436 TaxID=3346499 RepID=UPI00364C9095